MATPAAAGPIAWDLGYLRLARQLLTGGPEARMRDRTDRIFLPHDHTPVAGIRIEPVRRLAASGEIWVGDRGRDAPVPHPRQSVVVRGHRRYFG